MAYRRSEDGRSGDGVAPGRRAALLLAVVLLLAAALRFHRLDWDDRAGAHPDERAVASQVFDMLVRDDYRPTIHSWGHFGYYSTLFAYKAFLWAQHALNLDSLDDGERLVSVSGPTVPHFRELVRSGGALPLGFALMLAGWIAVVVGRRLLRRPRRLAIAALSTAAAIAIAAPTIRGLLLVPIEPDYDDVLFVGRFLSALCSTASVALVYAIGARLYRTAVGLLAAGFLAVAVVSIQLAHFYVVDPMQTFAVLLAMGWSTLLLRPTAASAEVAAAGVPWTTLAVYPMVGAAVGLALASKFSSLPLLALPLVVHVLSWERIGRRAPLAAHAALVLAYVATLGTWFALNPYAWESAFMPFAEAAATPELGRRWLQILFARDFAEQIFEQSQMVKGRAGGPWVQQFAGTTPFLTMASQLVRFGLGWPLGLVALAGLFWCALANLRRPRAEDLLLLSWAAVLFVILGTVQATFSRYTAPLIPFLCLFGALLCLGRNPADQAPGAEGWPLVSSRRRAGAVMAAIAFAGGLVYSVAFVRIYQQTHAWTHASLWIFKNVPPVRSDGLPTRIAHEDWDDQIPLRLPSYRPELYGAVSMAPYDGEGDGEEKLRRLATWLEDADWICLPTTRLYGTILGVPDRYPVTASYYKALFAGRLGFTLRRTVWERPRLWRLALDDLAGADESHYVYDHPKAVIFEKTERLDRSELERRIRDLPSAIDALSRAQILRWRESAREEVWNVARDPYLQEAVLTRVELESLLRAESLDLASTRAFLAALEEAKVAVVGAVDAAAVGAIVAAVSPRADAAEMAGVRRRLEALATDRAYRVGDLRRVAAATVLDAAARDRLMARLHFPVEGRLLPRAAVLAKLDRVEIGVDRSPGVARATAARAGDGRRVKVVAVAGGGGQILAAVGWLAMIEALGLAVLPWALRLFSALPGTGYLLAKTLGWVLATAVAWTAVNLGLAALGTPVAWAALAALAAAAWGPPGSRRGLLELLPSARLVVVSELLFVLTFAGFALVRAFNPEIFWGEKTMDFSLLNAVLRGGTLPPYEPWFSGVTLNYYYYGFVLVAYLTLLIGTPSALAFNLANAAIPALSVLGAFAVAHALTRRIRWGLTGAALVGFLGNLDPLYQLARHGHLAAAWREWVSAAIDRHGFLLGRLQVSLEAPLAAIRILLETPGEGSLWDSYWATSRALSEGLISEYPVWSWLFADLHAHVIAMPLSPLVIALLLAVFVDRRSLPGRGRRLRAATWGALALTLGAQLAANTWDFLAYSSVLVLALGAAFIGAENATGETRTSSSPWWRLATGTAAAAARPDRAQPGSATATTFASGAGLGSELAYATLFLAAWALLWPLVGRAHPYWLGLIAERRIGFALALGLIVLARLGDRPVRLLAAGASVAARLAREALLPALLAVAAAIALYAHFHVHFDTGETTLKLNRDGFITVVHAARHFGLFALLTALWVAASVSRAANGSGARRTRSIVLLGGGALAAAAAVRWDPLREASGLVFYLLLLFAVTVAGGGRRDGMEHRFTTVLLAGGWGLAAASELIVLGDRMNTVFKLYQPVWMLLALGSTAALAAVVDRGWAVGVERLPGSRSVRPRPLPAAAAVLVAGAILVAIAGTWRGVAAVVTLERRASDRPTLDGLDFLRRRTHDAELLQAIGWFNDAVRGPSVVAEAFTDRSYDESARISQYTGLPIVLGWRHHLLQRGRTAEQISLRDGDLERLYTSTDPAVVAEVCRRYDVRYVVVGDLERDRYGPPEARFATMGFLSEVFRSGAGGYIIYAVRPQSSPAM